MSDIREEKKNPQALKDSELQEAAGGFDVGPYYYLCHTCQCYFDSQEDMIEHESANSTHHTSISNIKIYNTHG